MILSGKNVLITGCNRGIGKALLEAFAQNGANVLACIRHHNEDFEKYIAEISEKYKIVVTPYYFDLMNEDEIKDTIAAIYKSKVSVDVLVNNAGVVTKGLLQMTPIERIKDVFQVNFFGQVQLTQGISRIMMKQRHGVIINMASIGGMDAYPAYVSYGCSKAAMIYFTKTLSQELASYGIRVNAIAPSMTDTQMKIQMGEEASSEIMRRTALKRVSQPEEIAKLAVFLASDDSSFITGQTIRIDGGLN